MADSRGHIRRSLVMLEAVRGPVLVSVALGLTVSALPFVSNAAFGPVMQAVADAGRGGNLSAVWELDGAMLSREDAPTAGFLGWLATPMPFAVLVVVWAASLVLAQALSFVKAWIDAQVEWKLLTAVRQRVHDHIQSLSMDFFTGTRSGVLMQRVQFEAAGVQRLLTDCLIPPAIDTVVLLAALVYLALLSWQMTIVALILSPLALMALRFAGARLQVATQLMLMTHRAMGGELEETLSGISEIQIFNAQQQRSEQFHEVSRSAAKSTAWMRIWMQAGTTGAQVFVAVSTVLVLIVGVAFSAGLGLTFAGLVVFVGFVPTMFASVQRIIQAYTTYKSTVPNVEATYELLDTRPTVYERRDAVAVDDVRGNVAFEDVVFGYTPQQKILDGLSFSVKEGETLALVGPIGSGKSTIFNLMLRFLTRNGGGSRWTATISAVWRCGRCESRFRNSLSSRSSRRIRYARTSAWPAATQATPRSRKRAGWRTFTA